MRIVAEYLLSSRNKYTTEIAAIKTQAAIIFFSLILKFEMISKMFFYPAND